MAVSEHSDKAILDPVDARRSVCRLETIGRSSGLPRELEIWFAAEGDRVFMLAGGGDRAHWVRNLLVNPEVRVRLGGRWYEGRAAVIAPTDPDDQLARELLAAKYQGWAPGRPLSRWAATSLPVVINLSK